MSELLSERQSAAYLMILGFVVFTVGGILYTGRAIWTWPIAQTPRYLLWERGFVILALLATVLGLVLLEDLLQQAGDSGVARLGVVMYGLGAAVVVIAETSFLGTHEWAYPQVVFYVVIAFLAQALLGVSLLQTELVADWVGWITIIWNLGWLIMLLILSPRDIYFPVLHHMAPLIIGITLLVAS
ncbi:MAG: hypothetical protein H6673_10185 [Anaerolineales bacterium]|nr:hypothetical protein [Anaerolineales bacterium]